MGGGEVMQSPWRLRGRGGLTAPHRHARDVGGARARAK